MAVQKVEYKFPHEEDDNKIEVESSSAEEVKFPKNEEKETDSGEFEIEVVDDTPPEDRGRKPSEPPSEVTEEELEEYSERVRNRIKHFSKGYHDERRAKEQAMRERQELERLAQQLVEENKQLKTNMTKSEAALLEQAKKSVQVDLARAKIKYKQAYEAGDADKVLAAQEELTAAKLKADKLEEHKTPALQQNESNVENREVSSNPIQEAAPAPEQDASPVMDEKARLWAEENPWFGKDEEMTSLALGLHNKLVRSGVNPQSDEYYERINARMRQVFPDQFGEPEYSNSRPKKSNVVAPATRSTAPKKIRLTQTQLTLAKKLGLTPEQYAKQVALEMRKQNG